MLFEGMIFGFGLFIGVFGSILLIYILLKLFNVF